MSDPEGAQGGAFEITPEEDRFLRAFFRRQALRYLAVLAALAVLAVTGTILLRQEADEPPSAAARPDPGTVAALEGFRAESRQLRDDFDALNAGVEKRRGVTAAEVAAVNDRIEALLSRLERLEQKATAAANAAPDAALLERIERLEQRSSNLEESPGGAGAEPSSPGLRAR